MNEILQEPSQELKEQLQSKLDDLQKMIYPLIANNPEFFPVIVEHLDMVYVDITNECEDSEDFDLDEIAEQLNS